jgi:hypothetical protein
MISVFFFFGAALWQPKKIHCEGCKDFWGKMQQSRHILREKKILKSPYLDKTFLFAPPTPPQIKNLPDSSCG